MTRLAELRALLAKATPGPWKVHDCGHRYSMDKGRACGIVSEIEKPTAWSSKPIPIDVMTSDARDECGHPISEDDAAVIVAMRNSYEALLDVANSADSLDRVFRGSIVTESAIGRRLRDALVNLRAITDVHGDKE